MPENNRQVIELAEYEMRTQGEDMKGLFLTEEDQKLAEDLTKKGILDILELKKGLRISASSNIGVAQFTNFTVTVLPKVLMGYNSLPKLIEYAYDLDDLIIPESEIEFDATKNILIEIIISSFVNQCQKLLRQGLVKSYVTYQENIPYLRGKLLVQQHLLNTAYKKLQFACEYDELEYDNLENRILRFTLETSYSLTTNGSLKQEIRRLIHQISGFVEKNVITLDDFEKINYTRLNQHYQKIHKLCKLILTATGIEDFYERKIPFVNSFFVDMNVIFEEFVARLFNQYYPLPSEAQKNEKAWIIDNQITASIRTDILVYGNDGKPKTVIDTKYKKSLTENDRFQIGFYIHDYKTEKGYAILPKHGDLQNQEMTSIQQKIKICTKRIDIDDTISKIFDQSPESKEFLKKLVEDLVPP